MMHMTLINMISHFNCAYFPFNEADYLRIGMAHHMRHQHLQELNFSLGGSTVRAHVMPQKYTIN
jgi:hypothetical protein